MHASRRALIAGNWKMHHGGPSAVQLAHACVELSKTVTAEIVIAPPYTALAAVAHECDGSKVGVSAQNVYPKDTGAFTGEVSSPMLLDAGCTYVIIGHSERRQLFGETDASVAEKTRAAVAAGLKPIVCVGETLQEREGGKTIEVVERQVRAVLNTLADATIPVTIAYEPVWAIGTGKVATPTDAEEVHASIRAWLAAESKDLADRCRILYGGSVKPDNAKSLFACPNIDGALIGGASLEIASFGAIARCAEPT
jgi:triosephosphate isomerase